MSENTALNSIYLNSTIHFGLAHKPTDVSQIKCYTFMSQHSHETLYTHLYTIIHLLWYSSVIWSTGHTHSFIQWNVVKRKQTTNIQHTHTHKTLLLIKQKCPVHRNIVCLWRKIAKNSIRKLEDPFCVKSHIWWTRTRQNWTTHIYILSDRERQLKSWKENKLGVSMQFLLFKSFGTEDTHHFECQIDDYA